MHTEPERAEGVKQAFDAFSKIFAFETGQRDKAVASAADPASPSDADSMKKQLLTLLGGMDSQDHLKLAGLKSFLNDEMADASRSEGKSISSGDLGEFVKNQMAIGKWGSFYTPICSPVSQATA